MKYILSPVALLYFVISQCRQFLYSKGFLRIIRLDKPVVSVGNLTLGGTGKTPFVDLVLTQLEKKNIRSAVLTRGYGRTSKKTNMVSKSSSCNDVGDEPRWLSDRHPRTKILVSRNRAVEALTVSDVDLFLLDDGLQHFKLHRDLEITLIDTTRGFSDYWPLPSGKGRSPFSVLKKTHLVVLTRVDEIDGKQLSALKTKISKFYSLDMIEASVFFDSCENIKTQSPFEIGAEKVFLVSGIGNPESFESLVTKTFPEVEILKHLKFRDHFRFSKDTLTFIFSEALKIGANVVMTTEKDGVKWKELVEGFRESERSLPVLIVKTKLVLTPPLPDIYDLALKKFH